DEKIFDGNLLRKEFAQAVDLLKAGVPASEALKELKTVIRYDQVSKVESNLHTRRIIVSWKASPASKETNKHLFCPDKDSRDGIVPALDERLGSKWLRRVYQETLSEAIAAPLVVAIGGGLLTVGLALTAHWLEGVDVSLRGSRMGRIVGLIGAILKYI